MVDTQTIGVLVTAASLTVAAIYYIFNMRTTLQTRQAQLFMQLYSQYYNKDWLEALRRTSFDMMFAHAHVIQV